MANVPSFCILWIAWVFHAFEQNFLDVFQCSPSKVVLLLIFSLSRIIPISEWTFSLKEFITLIMLFVYFCFFMFWSKFLLLQQDCIKNLSKCWLSLVHFKTSWVSPTLSQKIRKLVHLASNWDVNLDDQPKYRGLCLLL